ncbi:MAG: hypothetical protein DI585_02600 [Pseudomonas fluorescens]|nr:MAG: hypothetical protein DI585_02600 [Pseudomonas fluorescens]
MARILLAGLLLLAFASHTYAQTGGRYASVEEFTAYQNPKVQAIFNQQQRNLKEKCQAAFIKKATALVIQQQPVFVAQDKLTEGHWVVRYVADVCGTPSTRTAEFKVVSGGVAINALAPGDTLADGKLQADILHSLALSANQMMPQCREEPNIRNTTITIHPGTVKDRWTELWIAEFCNRDIAQGIEFLPTKGGTTFKMNVPNKTIKVQKI